MYKVEKRVLEEAPEIRHDDIMTMTEAAERLGVTVAAIDGYMARGRLTTVIDDTSQTAYGNPRRLVLRKEIEELAREREERRGKSEPAGVVAERAA